MTSVNIHERTFSLFSTSLLTNYWHPNCQTELRLRGPLIALELVERIETYARELEKKVQACETTLKLLREGRIASIRNYWTTFHHWSHAMAPTTARLLRCPVLFWHLYCTGIFRERAYYFLCYRSVSLDEWFSMLHCSSWIKTTVAGIKVGFDWFCFESVMINGDEMESLENFALGLCFGRPVLCLYYWGQVWECGVF